MKHSLLLCLTFAAIIVNSCKTENQNNLETIFCNTEHADSTMGQYIENVSVLVLETGDNVIRNADKISFLNEKIYIGDFRSRRLFVFDMTGKLDFIVDRSGRGPQEYLEIKTFTVDDSNIYILDNYRKAINLYNSTTGEFVRKMRCPIVAWDMEVLHNKGFIFAFAPMEHGKLNEKQKCFRLHVTDSALNTTHSYYPLQSDEYDILGFKRYFSVTDSSIVYSSFLANGITLLNKTDGHIEKEIDIHFPVPVPEKKKRERETLTGNYNYLLDTPIICNDYMMLDVNEGDFCENYMYIRKERKCVKNREAESTEGYISNPSASYDNAFVSVIAAEHEYLELTKCGLLEYNPEVHDSINNDKPVLVFYHMRTW